MEAKVKLLTDKATLPTRSSPGAAGLDLYAAEQKVIQPGSRELVETDISIEIPVDHVGLIWPRSGLAVRSGMDVLAGVIDCDYRGGVAVALINHGFQHFVVEPGERIAQLVIQPYTPVQLIEADRLGETHRGALGFGSSGK